MPHNSNVNSSNWYGIGFGLGLMILAAFLQFKMSPVLADMARQFDYSPLLSGAYMSVYAVAGLALARWFGHHMHDRGAEKLILKILLLAFAATCLGYAFPAYEYIMLLSRGLEGISACCLSIAGPAVISRFAKAEKQGMAAAIIALWIPTGVIFAGLISLLPDQVLIWTEALKISHIWQISWIISLVLTLLLLGILLRFRYHKIDLLDHNHPAHQIKKGPSLWESLPHKNANRIAALTFLFWSSQNIAFMSWLPSFLSESLGYNREEAALIFIAPIAFLGLFNLLAAPIMRHIPVAHLLCSTILGQAACAILMFFLIPDDYKLIQFLFLMLYGAFAGVTPSCLFRMPNLIFGKQAGTRAFGQIMMFRNIGVLTGPMIIAAALQFSDAKWASLGLLVVTASLISSAISYILIVQIRKIQPA